MKTHRLALPLLLSAVPLWSQQPTAPSGQAPVEQRANETNRRPMAANAPGGREGRMDRPAMAPAGFGQNIPPRADPFMESFFPPELIMHHQQDLGLTDDQRKRLIDTIQKSQPQFTELQWQLEAEQSALTALMHGERVDEKLILAQLDKVLQLESSMKRGQLTMLVRLKNELTPQQQAKLRESMRRPWMGGPNQNAGPAPARGPSPQR